MIEGLLADLDKEMAEAKVIEKNAQEDYEKMMAEAGEKRAQDSKSITEKAASKAASEEQLEAESDNKAGASKDLAGVLQYIHSLHGECDFLLKYFEVRKTARAGEVDALGKAKAVLNGADFSLLQTRRVARAQSFLGVH